MFNELLGFAVLTGPLWLILLLLPLSIWVAARISRRFAPGRTRWVTGAGVFVLVFLLLFADEIAGRMYFSYLCATQAGVKVYQTVELPGEYWDERGVAKFVIREGYLDFDEAMLGHRFSRDFSSHTQSSFFMISRDSYQLVERSPRSVLGEDVNFRHRGGWVSRNLSPNISARACSRRQVGYFTDVLNLVFRPVDRK